VFALIALGYTKDNKDKKERTLAAD